MILLGADQSAAPAWLHLWWMTRPRSRQWERKVQKNFCYIVITSSIKLFEKKKKSFLSLLLSICCFEVSICKLDSFLFFSFLNSTPHVPAHILDTPARAASDPPEETLHWEGDPDQCSTVSAAHQTQLQVSGECMQRILNQAHFTPDGSDQVAQRCSG